MDTQAPATEVVHLSTDQIDSAMAHVLASPSERGTLELVLRRPGVDEREVLDVADLDPGWGVVGDTWRERSSSRTGNGEPHPDMQLNVINARFAELVAQSRDRMALAGDQLYVDFDITESNLPAWTRLGIGTAVIEVTDQAHTGCAKFTRRFGLDAMRYANAPERVHLRLRGLNARVVQAGQIRRGDTIVKL